MLVTSYLVLARRLTLDIQELVSPVFAYVVFLDPLGYGMVALKSVLLFKHISIVCLMSAFFVTIFISMGFFYFTVVFAWWTLFLVMSG